MTRPFLLWNKLLCPNHVTDEQLAPRGAYKKLADTSFNQSSTKGRDGVMSERIARPATGAETAIGDDLRHPPGLSHRPFVTHHNFLSPTPAFVTNVLSP